MQLKEQFFENGILKMEYTNSGSAISAGDVVTISDGTGTYAWIAVDDIAASSGVGTIVRNGMAVELAKVATETWSQGDNLYWNGTSLQTTGTSVSTYAGIAQVAVATTTTAVGRVLLDGARPNSET